MHKILAISFVLTTSVSFALVVLRARIEAWLDE